MGVWASVGFAAQLSFEFLAKGSKSGEVLPGHREMYPRSRIRENSEGLRGWHPNSHESGYIKLEALRIYRPSKARPLRTALADHERLGNSRPNGRQQP